MHVGRLSIKIGYHLPPHRLMLSLINMSYAIPEQSASNYFRIVL